LDALRVAQGWLVWYEEGFGVEQKVKLLLGVRLPERERGVAELYSS
jgi:hypothetical protein